MLWYIVITFLMHCSIGYSMYRTRKQAKELGIVEHADKMVVEPMANFLALSLSVWLLVVIDYWLGW